MLQDSLEVQHLVAHETIYPKVKKTNKHSDATDEGCTSNSFLAEAAQY